MRVPMTIGCRMRRLVVLAAILSAPAGALAQSSASYRLAEHVLNAGGHPAAGVVASSPSFWMSLDSIGGAAAEQGLAGPSYRLDGGFVPAYRPPGEVDGLALLDDGQTLAWSCEPASTSYEVYSGLLSTLPGPYGGCAASGIAATAWVDPSTPGSGDGLFYLVTGRNRLGEEGTKGSSSDGMERTNAAPCP